MRRRWILAALGGAVALWAVIQVLPSRGRGANLELMVLGADGRFADAVTIPNHWADTTGAGGAVLRVPLILAVYNSGNEPAPPTKLELSLPARYRISRADGRHLPAEFLPGTPMVRYWIDVPSTKAATSAIAGYLPVLDTVWLEPIIPAFYCITLADSVPDFVPSPPAPVEAISRVRIFYSFTGEELDQRQTGLLAVELDPKLLEREAPEPTPVFPTQYGNPGGPRPHFSSLRYVGSRNAHCGDPQDPIEILSTLWETPEGGRFFVLDYGGAPRKYLFDLNRDSIIELEIWDANGSGNFDARRQARLPIPSFLMPPTPAPQYDASYLAELPPEQLLALDRYNQAMTEPYRFRTRPPEGKPNLNRFRPGTLGDNDSDSPGQGVTIRYWTDPAAGAAATGGAPPVVPGQQGPPAAETAPPSAAPAAPPAPAGPPTLGRPLTRPDLPNAPRTTEPSAPRPTDQPGERPATPPASGEQPDRRPGQQPARPPAGQDPQQQPTERPAPTPSRPSPDRTEPKVLGRPLDSIPQRPPPDTTGRRP